MMQDEGVQNEVDEDNEAGSVHSGESTEADKSPESTDQQSDSVSADFKDGFNSVAKDYQDSPSDASPADSSPTDDKPPQEAPDKGEPVDGKSEFDLNLKRRLRSIEGRYGEINSNLLSLRQEIEQMRSSRSSTDNKGQVSPDSGGEGSETQPPSSVTAEEIVEDFPHLQVFKDKSDALERELNELKSRYNVGQGTPSPNHSPESQPTTDEIAQKVALDTQIPGWEKEVEKPEFVQFVLDGGPEDVEYGRFLSLAEQQDKAVSEGNQELAKALGDRRKEVVQSFMQDFPDWYKAKGEKLIFGGAADSVSLVKDFMSNRVESPPSTSPADTSSLSTGSQQPTADQLGAAYVPRGVGAPAPKNLSDDDEFDAGFKDAIAGY